MVWTLYEFADVDLSTKSSSLSSHSRRPHKTKGVSLPDGGICFPLKSEYDRVNYTLEGMRQSTPPSALELPSVDDLEGATARVLLAGDRWVKLGKHWMRIHTIPRASGLIPQLEEGGPDLSTLLGMRITFKPYARGHVDTIADDWKSVAPDEERYSWTGTTTFLIVDPSPNQETDTRAREE